MTNLGPSDRNSGKRWKGQSLGLAMWKLKTLLKIVPEQETPLGALPGQHHCSCEHCSTWLGPASSSVLNLGGCNTQTREAVSFFLCSSGLPMQLPMQLPVSSCALGCNCGNWNSVLGLSKVLGVLGLDTEKNKRPQKGQYIPAMASWCLSHII